MRLDSAGMCMCENEPLSVGRCAAAGAPGDRVLLFVCLGVRGGGFTVWQLSDLMPANGALCSGLPHAHPRTIRSRVRLVDAPARGPSTQRAPEPPRSVAFV